MCHGPLGDPSVGLGRPQNRAHLGFVHDAEGCALQISVRMIEVHLPDARLGGALGGIHAHHVPTTRKHARSPGLARCSPPHTNI